MGRRLVISDIHGCLSSFKRAVDQVNLDQDRLYLLGDYIDRGEDSRGVISLVKSLVSDGAVALQGNHENMLVTGRYDIWMYNGGQDTLESYDGRVDESDIEFMKSLPIYHEEEDYFFVHAGIDSKFPLFQQSEFDMLWVREGFIDVEYTGKTVVFGHTPTKKIRSMNRELFPVRTKEDLDQKWNPIILGEYGNRIAVDSGCVFGGYLSMVDIDSKEFWLF